VTLSVRIAPDESEVTIQVSGQFDVGLHREFREAFRTCTEPGARYQLDLHAVERLDSSALGMLLLLREHAGGEDAKIEVVGAGPQVKRILQIANFDKMFTIQ